MAHNNINERRRYIAEKLNGATWLPDSKHIAKLFDCSLSAILADIKYIVSTRDGCTIYGLSDPETGLVRYVGQTDGDPEYRYHRHIAQSQYGREKNITKSQWITNLLAKGQKPGLVILERCSYSELNKREQWWIKHYLDMGIDLVNVIGKKGGRPKKQTE